MTDTYQLGPVITDEKVTTTVETDKQTTVVKPAPAITVDFTATRRTAQTSQPDSVRPKADQRAAGVDSTLTAILLIVALIVVLVAAVRLAFLTASFLVGAL